MSPRKCPHCGEPFDVGFSRCKNCGWEPDVSQTWAATRTVLFGCGTILFGAIGICSLTTMTNETNRESPYAAAAWLVGAVATLLAIGCGVGIWRNSRK